MTSTQLQDLARIGAEARLVALDQERDEILKVFPELRNGARQNGAEPKAGKSRMSPEARRRQGERMRKYWAGRRAAKKAAGARKSSAKKSASMAKRKGGMSAEARKAQGERMRAYWAAKRAEKQGASGEGAQTEAAASTNGAATRKPARKAGRKQGRKK